MEYFQLNNILRYFLTSWNTSSLTIYQVLFNFLEYFQLINILRYFLTSWNTSSLSIYSGTFQLLGILPAYQYTQVLFNFLEYFQINNILRYFSTSWNTSSLSIYSGTFWQPILYDFQKICFFWHNHNLLYSVGRNRFFTFILSAPIPPIWQYC